jgi:DNA mismatch repair protein MutS
MTYMSDTAYNPNIVPVEQHLGTKNGEEKLENLPLTFISILSQRTGQEIECQEAPTYFEDLHLDQIIDAITASKNDYGLKPFFYTPLHDVETIAFRHAVMQDMQDPNLMRYIKVFTENMSIVRSYLELMEKIDFPYHKKGWFLEAALSYCEIVTSLARNLTLVDLKSQGLLAFRQYLSSYIQSPGFQSLLTEALEVKNALAKAKYRVIIQSGKFKVQKYEEEEGDYALEVEKVFEKFKQGAVKDYRLRQNLKSDMNHIEAIILDFVARLYPEPFAALDQFCERQSVFLDKTILIFEREIQFYIVYLEFVATLARKGLVFCYPKISTTSREVYAEDAFDLALACTLLHTRKPVICNDFFLKGPERIIVVSGPNQGGKTTFGRMFGQLHFLASLGCPVPAREARLFLFDQIFTHFERTEDIQNLRGKLQDDLVRIRNILDQATSKSILILNEMFASTTLDDALFLSKEIMARVMDLDLLCVWVTFIDELSTLSEKTISMVSTVVPENPGVRTFKIIRKPADGLAYALSIVEKYHLTFEQIKERIQP